MTGLDERWLRIFEALAIAEGGYLSPIRRIREQSPSPLHHREQESLLPESTLVVTPVVETPSSHLSLSDLAPESSSLETPSEAMSNPTIPDFRLCGQFTGEEGQSGLRWLQRLEWDLHSCKVNGVIPPERYLEAVNLLLVGRAERWLRSDRTLRDLINNPSFYKPPNEMLADTWPSGGVCGISVVESLARLRNLRPALTLLRYAPRAPSSNHCRGLF